MYRKLRDIKVKNSLYLILVVVFMGFNYYVYNFEYIPRILNDSIRIPI